MIYKEWLNEWLECYVKPTVKIRTFSLYERTAKLHISPSLGDRDMSELNAHILQTYIAEQTQKFAPNTVKGITSVLRNSLDRAYMLGLTEKRLSDFMIRPKVTEKQVECFTVAEQKTIENYIKLFNKDKLFGIVLCLYSGLRIGELLAIEWKDIDFTSGLLTVNRTCYDTWVNGKFEKKFDDSKTSNSRRVIPLPKQIIQRLKTLKKKSKGEYIVNNDGEGISVRSYQRTFELLLNKLKIRHKGFHALRHTFATRAIECGMDVKTLSEILGHKNPTITLNRYTHSLIEHKTAMMNKLGKLLD